MRNRSNHVLMWAISNGHIEVVRLLLSTGEDFDSILMNSINEGNMNVDRQCMQGRDTIMVMVEDADRIIFNGQTPIEVVEYYLEFRINVLLCGISQPDQYFVSLHNRINPKFIDIEYFIERMYDIGRDIFYATNISIIERDLDVARLFLKYYTRCYELYDMYLNNLDKYRGRDIDTITWRIYRHFIIDDFYYNGIIYEFHKDNLTLGLFLEYISVHCQIFNTIINNIHIYEWSYLRRWGVR